MKELVEKILERLDEPQFYIGCGACPIKEKCDEVQENINDEKTDLCAETMRVIAKEIVQEVAEEYNGGWIPCSERLPEEKLCEDGKYDPSEKVLIQLDNEEMFTSRYWSHRHSKDSDDFEKWIDLPDYYQDRVVAWQPLPEPFKDN